MGREPSTNCRWWDFSTDEAEVLFAAAIGPKKLLIFPGAGHNVFGAAGDGYVRQLEEFIRAALKTHK